MGGKQSRHKIVMLGLDGSGKSSICTKLTQGKAVVSLSPSHGSQVVSSIFTGHKIDIYDIGGSIDTRSNWSHYYPGAHGIIFVIDSY